ncbi:plasmid pRiA4b ORF-3 family protein [Bradyrhizobium ivorense]|uniref:plasmid pRiA4b ORF-3 family protein n=1 Tax=Bradyrhizobium ivorense TaxID=2511166 RepID=UPI001FCE5845|nr:plasmid pRiA4b ORF-3 family protein [Bradyrhizobium ivorense]
MQRWPRQRLDERTNSHLFEFLAGEGRWGIPDPDGDFGPQPIDARKARLSDIVQETGAKTIHYLYDFGDSWDHVIKLEKCSTTRR